jgi:hypothetical protein
MPFDGAELFLKGAPSAPPSPSAPPRVSLYLRVATVLRRTLRPSRRQPARRAIEEGALHLLQDARALIVLPTDWIQGVYETNSGQRCAIGALRQASLSRPLGVLYRANRQLLSVARQRGFPSVEMMNDRSTHEQVVAAFDEAIAAARLRVAGAA